MDLYPDVMFAHGLTRQDSLLFRFLSRLTAWQFKDAHTVLTLGPVMAARVSAYCQNDISKKRVRWTALWSNSELAPCPERTTGPLRRERGWADDEVVLLYSGNMGLGHRFAEFLETARHLSSARLRWVFAGSGKRRQEIEEFARANPSVPIQFLGYVPHEKLQAHLCSADVHLASLDAAWQGMMVPSKLQGSFAVGRPVLYVGGQQCETALWIQQSGGGWTVNENDVNALAEAVRQSLDLVERQKRGRQALAFAKKQFHKLDSVTIISQWLEGGSEVDNSGGEPGAVGASVKSQNSVAETVQP